MRTTLTQRIAAAEALIITLRAGHGTYQRKINKLVAERSDLATTLSRVQNARNEGLEIISKLTDDLQDAKEDNDRLQIRLALAYDTLKQIRHLPHPWWTIFLHPNNCPICSANYATFVTEL